jgi:Anti-sigma factor NepR
MTQKPNAGNSGAHPPSENFSPIPEDPIMSGSVQDAIGRSLRAHFDDIANAPIPDKFLALLAELEAKEAGSDK